MDCGRFNHQINQILTIFFINFISELKYEVQLTLQSPFSYFSLIIIAAVNYFESLRN